MTASGTFETDIRKCFEEFTKHGQSALTRSDFISFLGRLFSDYDGSGSADRIFDQFDVDRDGKINFSEFEAMWKQWVTTVLHPKNAFVVVDVQNDFISGTLALGNFPAKGDPNKVIPVINKLSEVLPWTMVVYTHDWHPENHVSFFENRFQRSVHASSKVTAQDAKLMDTIRYTSSSLECGYYEQVLWPRHCVQNSWGSQLHSELRIKPGSHKIYKGTNPELDSYSAFWDNSKLASTSLDVDLRAAGVTDVFVCGLATDVCVGSTALHALELGYRTFLVEDASCGVAPDSIEAMKSKIMSQNGVVTTSDQVPDLVSARRRPWAAGRQLASSIGQQHA